MSATPSLSVRCATSTRYADDLVSSHEDKAFSGGRLFAAIGDIVAAQDCVLNADNTWGCARRADSV